MESSDTRTGPELMAGSGTAQITQSICSDQAGSFPGKQNCSESTIDDLTGGLSAYETTRNAFPLLLTIKQNFSTVEESLATVTHAANTKRMKHCYHVEGTATIAEKIKFLQWFKSKYEAQEDLGYDCHVILASYLRSQPQHSFFLIKILNL